MRRHFTSWPDMALSAALLGAAAVLVVIALWPGHPIVKGATLAWVILP